MENTKGFTLIELLIVIAIIGILASIVFVNLGASRNQAKDAAIKADLDSMRLNAEQIYEAQSDGYLTVCQTDPVPSIARLSFEAAKQNGHTHTGNCQSSQYRWAACVYENINATGPSPQAWCVDNRGISKEISITDCAGISIASPACP